MIDRKITINNLETNIRWIEDIPCHQFPGWWNVTMSMRDALELLKEHEPKPIVNKWHKNTLGDYSRLHCPWCDRELDMQSAKEYVACPYCGRPVTWDV